MTNLFDPIERLRDERPDATSDPRLVPPHVALSSSAPSRTPRASRRRRLQLGIVAAVATAIVLTGAVTLRSQDDGPTRVVTGISVAEAREQAIGALTSLKKLDAYTYAMEWELTSDDGRTYQSSTSISRDGSDSLTSRWSRDDFRDVPKRDGIPELIVDDYIYEGRGHSTAISQPWLLDVKDGWRAPEDRSRPMSNNSFMFRELPDFAVLVEQLDREGLIDARRDDDGAIIVEIDRPAGDLAPVTSSMSGSDPIAEFAMGIKHAGSPTEPVHVEIVIGEGGDLRQVQASARTRSLVANGKPGGETVTGVTRVEHRVTPLDTPISKPDPTDVMVVGNILKSRRGETGMAGQLGTLDTLTVDELRDLRREARHTPNAMYDSWGIKRPTRPARSYPDLFKRNRARMAAARAAARALNPGNLAGLADNPACSPLWPDSKRAMDRDTAMQDRSKAGWRCTLPDDLGAATVLPGSKLIELEVRIGRNGLSLSSMKIEDTERT